MPASALGKPNTYSQSLISHTAEQQALWDRRGTNPFPVARPGTSLHEHGNAADVTVGGRPIQGVISRDELVRAGLAPLAGDAVHVELPR